MDTWLTTPEWKAAEEAARDWIVEQDGEPAVAIFAAAKSAVLADRACRDKERIDKIRALPVTYADPRRSVELVDLDAVLAVLKTTS